MTKVTKSLLLANGFWNHGREYGNGIVNLYDTTDACGRLYLQGTFQKQTYNFNIDSMETLQQFLDIVAPHCSESDQKHLKLKF